jgi:hypothetical protein
MGHSPIVPLGLYCLVNAYGFGDAASKPVAKKHLPSKNATLAVVFFLRCTIFPHCGNKNHFMKNCANLYEMFMIPCNNAGTVKL